MGRLDGKVALITGGARGMGASHVRHFVAEGAQVVSGDVRDDEGRAVAAELGESCRYVHHDVTSEADWRAAISCALDSFGQLDVLVNNAGILQFALIEDMSPQDFQRVLDVNAFGTWLGIRMVAEAMRTAGGGSIVNVSSVEGLTGTSGLSAYSASKFAVRGITRSAAQELGQFGIRVNSVHPGGVRTPMAAAAASAFARVEPKAFLHSLPIPRLGTPVEISRLVAFLASDDSSYCTGGEFLADGGMLSGPGY